MKKYIILLAFSLLATAALTSCGGPKYSDGFADWLKMEIAEKTQVRVNSADIEEIASTDSEAIFQFEATAETTVDLYDKDSLFDYENAVKLQDKINATDHTIAEQSGLQAIAKELDEFHSELPLLLEIATPKGHEIKITGKAKARLGTTDWEFEITEISPITVSGSAKPTNTESVMKGSSEADKASAKMNDIFKRAAAALTKAEAMILEKNNAAKAKAEQEEQDRKEKERQATEKKANVYATLLAKIAQDSEYIGQWQSTKSRGKIGLLISEGQKINGSYSADATIFDPNHKGNADFSEKVVISIVGEGTDTSPFSLEIFIPEPVGNSRPYFYLAKNGGFLNNFTRSKIDLLSDPDSNVLSGSLNLKEGNQYRQDPIQFRFQLAK